MGDEAHDFNQVWREVGPVLWRAMVAYAGGRADIADDAVAEAFARAIERDEQVRDPKAYLYRVAFRVVAAKLRRPTGAPVAVINAAVMTEATRPATPTLAISVRWRLIAPPFFPWFSPSYDWLLKRVPVSTVQSA